MTAVSLAAPLAGWLVNVRDVPDPVFSEEMLGIGVAIDPVDGKVVAPCSGHVLQVAPAKHSVTLRTEEGAELLIHIGLETVALGGRGFEAHVREGARVNAGDPLISFDMDLVGLEAKSLLTPLILTNPEKFRLELRSVDRLVAVGDAVASLEALQGSAPTESGEGESVSGECIIGFAHGLHARPAARIADCAKRFASDVAIVANGKRASAKSAVAIMALNVARSDPVSVLATGDDSRAALAAITAVLSATEKVDPTVAKSRKAIELSSNEIGGVCALPGAAVGTAFRWRREERTVPDKGSGVKIERVALSAAQATVRARLEALASATQGPGSDIARAHAALLDDEELNRGAAAAIAKGKSAARAWQLATREAADTLRETGNPLLRERIADLEDVSGQITAAILGEDARQAPDLPDDAILVADDLLPSELLSLDRRRLAGIALGGGGPTSHTAIIAASFGVPTLVAMGPQLSKAVEGARVLIDATAGKLVIDPSEEVQSRVAARARNAGKKGGECWTRDGQPIRLLANLGGVDEVEPALKAGAEGCGLLRTEFLFLDRRKAPGVKEQLGAYQAIADALGGRPLTIRTLDIGGDKPVPFIDFPDEQNPALGARGIRIRLLSPKLLDEQLRAISQVRSDAIKVMIPMVSSVDELRVVRERLSEVGDKTIKLGVMIETPAAALIAERLAAEADFLSIGSNDLAQYALAMDRTNPLLAAAIDALHPAVLKLIAMTAEVANAAGIPVSLCGNLASDPVGALVLIGLGIRELSGVPAALPAVRHAIAQMSTTECEALAARALQSESAREVRALAARLLDEFGTGEAG